VSTQKYGHLGHLTEEQGRNSLNTAKVSKASKPESGHLSNDPWADLDIPPEFDRRQHSGAA